MGRMYTIVTTSSLSTGTFDVFEFAAPSTKAVVLYEAHVGQTNLAGNSNAGMALALIGRATGSGSGGATLTPQQTSSGDPAASGTYEGMNTTIATGTSTALVIRSFNIQAGWDYVPIPEARIEIEPSGILVLRVGPIGAPGLSLTAEALFEEIG